MKVLVVILTLLFFTGAQDQSPRRGDPKRFKYLSLMKVLGEYIASLSRIATQLVSRVDATDLGKRLDLNMVESFSTLSNNVSAQKTQLNVNIEKLKEEITADLKKVIPPMRKMILPIQENFQRNWDGEVKGFRDRVTPLMVELEKQTKDNMEVFYKLGPLAADFRKKLLMEIESLIINLSPYIEELRQRVIQKLEKVRANAGPEEEQYRALISHHIENLKKNVGPLAENLKEPLLPHVEEAKEKITMGWDDVMVMIAKALTMAPM